MARVRMLKHGVNVLPVKLGRWPGCGPCSFSASKCRYKGLFPTVRVGPAAYKPCIAGTGDAAQQQEEGGGEGGRPRRRWGQHAAVAPENTQLYLLAPKTDVHGLGFDPFKVRGKVGPSGRVCLHIAGLFGACHDSSAWPSKQAK